MTAIKQHRDKALAVGEHQKEDIDRQKIEKLPYEVSTVLRRHAGRSALKVTDRRLDESLAPAYRIGTAWRSGGNRGRNRRGRAERAVDGFIG
jgi:hypothetical protein